MALDELKKLFEMGNYSDLIQTKPAHPRDTVIKSLKHSLEFLRDSKFRVTRKGKKGTPSTSVVPPLCYQQMDNGKYVVWASYARQRLDLGGMDSLVVTNDKIEFAHEKLIDVVQQGNLDAQIEKMSANFKKNLEKNTKKKR